jgi:hypothetical protein
MDSASTLTQPIAEEDTIMLTITNGMWIWKNKTIRDHIHNETATNFV